MEVLEWRFEKLQGGVMGIEFQIRNPPMPIIEMLAWHLDTRVVMSEIFDNIPPMIVTDVEIAHEPSVDVFGYTNTFVIPMRKAVRVRGIKA